MKIVFNKNILEINMKRKLFYLVLPVIALLLGACGQTSSGGGSGSKTVPTYQGMTISKTTSGRKTNLIRKLGDDENDGEDVPPEEDNHEVTEEELEKEIDDIVTIDVQGDEQTKYFVQPNEVFIVEVHVSNPSDFEIQSFTLNGTKYANYMFKEGSTMELLLLETTAPSTSGYIEYTIDAIKYIDGTEIKDVKMEGDKTIKAGIAYPDGPTARVTSQVVDTTKIDLSINVTDSNNLIGDNDLAIYLTDGEKVVNSKKINVGNNTVSFDGLRMSSLYEYGVVTSFDLVNGEGLHSEWLTKNEFTTLSAFSFKDVKTDKTSITFDIEKKGEVGEIERISLYDSSTNKLVDYGDKDTRKFENLLSGRKYNLYLDFSYPYGEDTIKDFVVAEDTKTVAKTVPAITISNEDISDVSIEASYEVTDPDSLSIINSVELYKGSELVAINTSKEIDFAYLEAYTDYKVVINYSYDLNDGAGMREAKIEKEYKTSPHLEFVSCKVINTTAVNEGDTIYMQATLVNPSNATPVSAVVNGETYSCSGSTSSTKIYLEIVNNGQFKGGLTELTIEKVNMKIDGKEYSVLAKENNKSSIFINGKIDVVSATFVNSENEVVEYYQVGDSLYYLIEIKNDTGYVIDSLSFGGEQTKVEVTITDFEKIDINTYRIDVNANSQILNNNYFSQIAYHNEYAAGTVIPRLGIIKRPTKLSGTVEISTVEQLLTTNYYDFTGGMKCYKLMNDIDLSDTPWTKSLGSLGGVFDGNGHKISGITNVSSYSDSTPNLSLFEYIMGGLVQNLTIEDMTIIISANNTTNDINIDFGTIAYRAGGNIKNCKVSGDVVINNNTKHSDNKPGSTCVGGIAGIAGANVEISNCETNLSITVSSVYNGIVTIGGLVASVGDGLTIHDCKVNNTIVAKNNGRVAGLIANAGIKTSFTPYEITGCDIKGSVDGQSADAFVIFTNNDFGTNRTNISNNTCDVLVNGTKVTEIKDIIKNLE